MGIKENRLKIYLILWLRILKQMGNILRLEDIVLSPEDQFESLGRTD